MQLEHLIRSVLPVILLIIFGFWLQKRHYFSEETVQGVTKLVSDYLIPCTIFTTFIGLDLRPEHFGLAACTFLIQLLLLGLAFSPRACSISNAASLPSILVPLPSASWPFLSSPLCSAWKIWGISPAWEWGMSCLSV